MGCSGEWWSCSPHAPMTPPVVEGAQCHVRGTACAAGIRAGACSFSTSLQQLDAILSRHATAAAASPSWTAATAAASVATAAPNAAMVSQSQVRAGPAGRGPPSTLVQSFRHDETRLRKVVLERPIPPHAPDLYLASTVAVRRARQ